MKLGILAGPNGAGKSTYAQILFESSYLPTLPINLDVLSEFIDDSKIPHDMLRYESEKLRQLENLFYEYVKKAIKDKKDFSYENNLSYKEQLHPIKHFYDANYEITLTYICLDSIEQSKQRVKKRVNNGGHPVDDEKLIENFNLGLKNLDEIFTQINKVIVMENDSNTNSLLLSLVIEGGKLKQYKRTPKCFNKELTPELLKLISRFK